jgi:O-antigen ligase
LIPAIFLALIALVWGYGVFHYGGVVRAERTILLLAMGILALAHRLVTQRNTVPRVGGLAGWALLLLPVYVAFQAVPLPLGVVRILSPARAEAVEALNAVMPVPAFTSLSVFPEATMRHLSLICAYILTFLMLRDLTWRMKGRSWLAAAPIVFVGTLEAALGVAQPGSAEGISGTLVNRNHYAAMLAMTLPFCAMFAVAVLRGFDRRREFPVAPALQICGALGAAGLIIAAVMFSYSRMGFVACVLSLATIAVAARFGAGRAPLLSIGLGAAALVAVFVFLPPAEFIERFAEVSTVEGMTQQGRLQLWSESSELLREYPLFGCGMGGFESVFMRHKVNDPLAGDAFVHNDYLQFLIELGVVGFAILAAIGWGIVKNVLWTISKLDDRNERCLATACAGALMAIAVHSVVDFNLYTPAIAMLAAWICGIVAGLDIAPALARPEGLARRKETPAHSRRGA